LIDLDAIEANVRLVLRALSAGTKLMVVVKANAYGHGARMVAEAAIGAGADCLAVATLDEAMVLRDHGIEAPLQILGPVSVAEIDFAIERRIEISAGSLEFIEALASRSGARPISVHLKLDTGLRRFGVKPEEAVGALRRLASAPNVVIAGVFTHFGQADDSDERLVNDQHERFLACLGSIQALGLPTGLVHAANSAALLRSRAYDHAMVRLGISLYGIAPSPEIALFSGMRPAMTVVSRVQRVFDLVSGDGVSYGATFKADRPMRAALVPIGYGDGYSRALSSQGEMMINGTISPVLGRVCMDQTVVGLANNPGVVVNNEVTIIGGAGTNIVPIEDVARLAGTNPYEIVTAVSARVPRVYVRQGLRIAIEDLNGLHRLR